MIWLMKPEGLYDIIEDIDLDEYFDGEEPWEWKLGQQSYSGWRFRSVQR